MAALPALVSLLAALCASSCLAQVSISSVLVQERAIGPTTLFSTSLINSGPEVAIVLSGNVSADIGVVVRFRSAPFRIGTGARTVHARELTMQEFDFGDDPLSRGIAMEHRLPGGKYRFCLTVEPVADGEFGDRTCEDLLVEDLLFMDLVHPYDKDTIDEVRPPLSWMISGGKVPQGQTARLLLVPKALSSSASQAITAAPPVFVVDRLSSPWVPYPIGVPGLEQGKCYAWQVERTDGSLVVDRTEPWSFCVRAPRTVEPDRYVVIGEETDAVYPIIDGHVRFQFNDPYASDTFEHWISDEQGHRIEPDNDKAAPRPPPIVHHGARLYDLDLAPFGLRPGVYTLSVQDAKGRMDRLKFRIER